ncbi:MAG: hypothetical protein WCI72_00365 [archaeon]
MEREGDNSKLFLIGGIVVLLLIILGAFFWLNSSDIPSENNPQNISSEEDFVPVVTSGGCDKLGLDVASESRFSCFDSKNKLVKLYISRSGENVVFNRLDFVLYSSNDTVEYTSNYGLAPGSFYSYNIAFTEDSLEKIEITPIVQSDGEEEECVKIYVNSISPCVTEESTVEPAPGYYLDENLNVVLVNETANNTINASTNKSSEILTVFSSKPQKKILNFSFEEFGDSAGVIDELRHSITVILPEGSSKESLTPKITISINASISPSVDLVKNFTSPRVYMITASDESTQKYTVYVETFVPPVEVVIPEANAPSVYLFNIESSNSTSRSIKFNVSDENNLLVCSLFSNNVLQKNLTNLVNISTNFFDLTNLAVGSYSVFVKCTDTFNNTGSSAVSSFNVVAPTVVVTPPVVITPPVTPPPATLTPPITPPPVAPVIVTQVSNTIAGEWSTDLAAASAMATANKKFYIINIGNLVNCGYCQKAEAGVFSKPEFKAWAKANGIAMIYADDRYKDKEPTKSIYYRYVNYNIDYPQIIIVGYESQSAIASFEFRSGKPINGLIARITPSSFIELVDSYTSRYK